MRPPYGVCLFEVRGITTKIKNKNYAQNRQTQETSKLIRVVLFLSVIAIEPLMTFIYKWTRSNSGDDGDDDDGDDDDDYYYDEDNNKSNSGNLLECLSTAKAYNRHA
jgi:hypothetical protein